MKLKPSREQLFFFLATHSSLIEKAQGLLYYSVMSTASRGGDFYNTCTHAQEQEKEQTQTQTQSQAQAPSQAQAQAQVQVHVQVHA